MRKLSKTSIVIIVALSVLALCVAALALINIQYPMNAPVETRSVVLEDMAGVHLPSPYTFQQSVSENSTLQFQVHNIGNVTASIGLSVTDQSGATITLDFYSVTLALHGRQTITATISDIIGNVTSVSWEVDLSFP